MLKLNDDSEATTIGTGSAIIKGGVGIAKNLFVGGQTEFQNTLLQHVMLT